jgi:very-short-patch-repair endonuclease
MSGLQRAPVRVGGRGMVERRVADLAARQQGVIHRDQLLRLGVQRSRIARWRAAGRLHPLLPRVFAVGHPTLPVGGREMAALLWRGPHSALSHGSAAWALGFGPVPPIVDVSSAVGGTASRPGVRTHRLLRLDPVDVDHRRGLRITAGPRTLIDLADTESATELGRLVAEARYRRLVTDDQLRDAARRHPNRLGTSVLLSILDTEKEPAFTRSKAERELRRILKRAGLAFPRTNVRLGGYEVDAFWPDARLVVEVDGYEAHRGRQAFERDRRKAASLETAGYRVLRVSWRQLQDTPESVAAVVAAALASRR